MKPGFWEILLIVVLVLILFGHGKIPSLMKNLANGINIFKKELKETTNKKQLKPVAKKKTGSVKKTASKTSAKTGVQKVVSKKTATKK